MRQLRHLRRTVPFVAIMAAPACYDYVPVTTSPPVGEMVALEITDRGRVDLTDRFGPGIARIEGRLVSAPPDQYVVAISRVTQINGDHASWTGETARLSRDVVGGVQTRHFARTRTAFVAAAAAAGVVGFIVTRNWISSSSGGSDSTAGKGPASLRIPIGRFSSDFWHTWLRTQP
jgi:hypothetical protein